MTHSNQIITIIVAASENNVIGKNNDLIWRLPNDLKRFKELTSGHCIIMGRKTYESLPGILPNRKHIVLTRKHKDEFPENISVVSNFEEALYEARNDLNPFIIGGGEIYGSTIKFAGKIELTRVHENFDGDTYFPEINSDAWALINRVENNSDEKHLHNYTFETYIKKL
jgi:dihydrofolate reductase